MCLYLVRFKDICVQIQQNFQNYLKTMANSLFSLDKPLVLASSSSIRKDLLNRIIPEYEAISPDIDESIQPSETPSGTAKRLALEKALKVAESKSNHYIIGSDQMAVCGNQVISKPMTKEKAIQQLTIQSGQVTHFFTGICLLNSATNEYQVDAVFTAAQFRELSAEDIEAYVEIDAPYYCAGSFKAEANGITLFDAIESRDQTAILGLPLIRLCQFLRNVS